MMWEGQQYPRNYDKRGYRRGRRDNYRGRGYKGGKLFTRILMK